MKKLKSLNTRYLFSTVLAFFLSVHIVLTILIITFPKIRQHLSGALGQYYQSYAAIGPFFTEKSLSSSYELLYSVKADGWGPWISPQQLNHSTFCSKFDYQELKRGEYVKYLAWKLVSDPNPATLQYISDYISNASPDSPHIDSLRITTVLHSAEGRLIKTDTLISHTISFQ